LSVTESQGRRIALLIDTSASMRRADLWSQATARVEKVLDGLAPADDLALFAFDERVTPLVTFDQWRETELPRRAPLVRSRLNQVSPSWGASNLGDALASVADILADQGDVKESSLSAGPQLILISDLQQGSRIEALQGYEWPSGVLVDVQQVASKEPTNAGLQLAHHADDGEVETVERLRVRVTNDANSAHEQFSLVWTNKDGAMANSDPVKAYVPAGQSRIVRLPWPAKDSPADRLLLRGDAEEFDNSLYLVRPRQEQSRLLFIGQDRADDPQGLLYYLQSAVGETLRRKVEIIAQQPSAPLRAEGLVQVQLAVVSSPPSDDDIAALRGFIKAGGSLLYVLKEAAAAHGAAQLADLEAFEADEAPPRDFALLGRIQFEHPLFAPFADPRFADFTKIHFWKHRRVRLGEAPGVQVLAAFDDQDPFLFQRQIGEGRLIVATSGWHPADSQLALSTKFVPLIAGMFPPSDDGIGNTQRFVSEVVELPKSAPNAARTLRTPAGEQIELDASATTFADTHTPGVYRFAAGGQETTFAVNLAADESRTSPMAVEDLERRGARLGIQPTVAQLAERQRQARVFELENRQKLWRWLIIGVLAILMCETALAGHLAHKTLSQQVTA
jgi:hypothetical protein